MGVMRRRCGLLREACDAMGRVRGMGMVREIRDPWGGG